MGIFKHIIPVREYNSNEGHYFSKYSRTGIFFVLKMPLLNASEEVTLNKIVDLTNNRVMQLKSILKENDLVA